MIKDSIIAFSPIEVHKATMHRLTVQSRERTYIVVGMCSMSNSFLVAQKDWSVKQSWGMKRVREMVSRRAHITERT